MHTFRRGRSRQWAAGLAVVLTTVALTPPAAALAASKTTDSGATKLTTTTSNPIGGGLPTAPGLTQTTSTAPQIIATTTGSSGAGVSSGDAIAIAAAALIIIAGIGYAILRDARRRTPKGPVNDSIDRTPGSQRPPKGRKLSPAERKRRKRGRNPRRR